MGIFHKKRMNNQMVTVEQLNRLMGLKTEGLDSDNLKSATYYACMQIRCNAMAKLPVRVMQFTEESGSERKQEHPLNELLEVRPNRFMTPHDFKWATKFQELEYGNAYWVMTMKSGIPTGVYLLDSRRVQIMIDDCADFGEKNAIYYLYDDPKRGTVIYTSDSILHFKNFPSNGLVGKSVKSCILETIHNERYASSLIKNKYKTGLLDPVVVQYAGDLNDVKKDRIKTKFEQMGGAGNAGQVIPIPYNFKVSQLNTRMVDSQFFELQGVTARQIANAFGVKVFQLNDMEKSTYSNLEQQNKAFYSDTLQNDVISHEQEITYKALSKHDKQNGLYVHFNVDAVLRSDINTRSQAYATAINTGWQTRAEVRKLEGLPYIEGTDRLTVDNGAVVPLDKVGIQYVKGGDDNAEDASLPEKESENESG